MSNANWGKTRVMLERKQDDDEIDFIDGEPHYEGRHVIGRDTDIEGGVYLGGGEREAVVVDSEYGAIPELYEEAKEQAENAASRADGRTKDYALFAAYDTVRDTINFDSDEVQDIVERNNVEEDGKIALDSFINNEVGVCRHQALATGAIIEQFQDNDYLTGDVSVDRNKNDRGGHAWVRYENSGGDVQIIDPTQDVFAPLEETVDESWAYARPGDNI